MVKRLSTMQETRVQSLGREDPLEKEMAIHSSTIAWKIPWTEEPGRLQSMGSQRVRHDCVTNHITYRYTLIYSSVDGYLDCFHFGIYWLKKLYICVQVFAWTYIFISLGHIPGNVYFMVIWWLFNLCRSCQTYFSGLISLYSHWQYTEVLSLHHHQHLVYSIFLITAILRNGRWYLIVDLICISLMVSEAEHLFMCVPSEKCLFRRFAHF